MKRIIKRQTWLKAVIGICVLGTHAYAQDELDISAVQAALAAGEVQTLYQKMQALEAKYAGEVTFDALLGQVALAADDPAYATWVLERVLLLAPYHAEARLDLARAYLALGNYLGAQEQLHALLALKPPASAQAAIEYYLAQTEQALAPAQDADYILLVLAQGYNDNASAYPQLDLGLLSLDEIASPYTRLQGVYQYQKAWDTHQAFQWTTSWSEQKHWRTQAQAFDTRLLNSQWAWQVFEDTKNYWQVFTEAGVLWLDDDNYRQHYGVGARAVWQLNKTHQLISRQSLRDYHFDSRKSEYTELSWQLDWRYQPHPRWRLDTSLALATEEADQQKPNGDAWSWEAGFGVEYVVAPAHILAADYSYQFKDYSHYYAEGLRYLPGFDVKREDKRQSASISWRWQWNSHWQMVLSGHWYEQDANLPLYTYDQYQAVLSLSYFH
ncbi:Tetratricopeptide repeat-containing protein [Allopseudospirillum japonicum]|uniref:Tetratricopeptide repeat-containing protein n=1 Tax=Allopseudospirillum japonicum TaxID=64971 RepID=A0A1H6UPG5_9GAMM|nr:tetratricopeptide repeat protein [Allopseudospirillum japonicum]SEI90140.1 Tetratricopeptide repeat-containing protein [Allopseudospirillum japonicum]